jgi:Type II secretion system (T2SS), protein M
MTTRDRLMLMGIAVLAVLAVGWYMAVSPEREKASKVSAEVQSARQQLTSAETQASEALSAEARYTTAYTSLVTLGQAVPASTETPALIYTLDKATHKHDIEFSSITNGASGAGSSSSGSSSSSSSASSSVTSATQGAGLSQQPFTFVFNGSFIDLSKLLGQLEGFTVLTSSGPLQVSGRLLTIDSVTLAPDQSEVAGGSKASKLTGTITATAYVLPSGTSALGGASPSGPAGTQPGSATSSGSAATPAVVKVNP